MKLVELTAMVCCFVVIILSLWMYNKRMDEIRRSGFYLGCMNSGAMESAKCYKLADEFIKN